MDTDELEARLGSLEQFRSSVEYGASFLRFGADISNPALTALVIALSEGEYNGEMLAEGCVMLGDNTTGALNLLWTPAVGFAIRVGTDAYTLIDALGIQTNSLAFNPDDNISSTTPIDVDHNNKSYVRFSNQAAPFTVQHIKNGSHNGHFLILQNDCSHHMTIENGAAASADPTYSPIFTLNGADLTTTTFGDVLVQYNNDIAPPQWFVIAYNL